MVCTAWPVRSSSSRRFLREAKRMTITIPGRLLAWIVAAVASVAAVLAPQTQLVGAAQEQRPVAVDRAVEEIELTAAPLKWEIQPALVVDGWGFNNQVPGPLLKV